MPRIREDNRHIRNNFTVLYPFMRFTRRFVVRVRVFVCEWVRMWHVSTCAYVRFVWVNICTTI